MNKQETIIEINITIDDLLISLTGMEYFKRSHYVYEAKIDQLIATTKTTISDLTKIRDDIRRSI